MPRFWPFRRSSRAAGNAGAPSGAHRRLFGREYAAGVPYALPSDLSEMNRLDFQHYMLRQAFKGIYAAPIGTPATILDVGAGTGRWAKEMAALFPQARIVALDIKEPAESEQSQSGAASTGQGPSAYTFVRGNILEGLPFPDATFDFVHQRLLFFAIPSDRWQFVVNELMRVTRPGGWVEIVEGHYGYEPMGQAAQRIADAMLPAMLRRGIDPRHSANLAQFLQAAGLRDVQTRTVKVPVGDWGGHLGHLALTDVMTFSQAARPLLLAQGMSEPDFARLVETMREECERLRYTWPFYIAYGQRA
ncbi:MAG TPA: class I SAM-dependent methyltransferase [Ktedonobacterales bacterium]|nr:class I SAM-dependent methyltransferase [Ktedonobacterales bacterium]